MKIVGLLCAGAIVFGAVIGAGNRVSAANNDGTAATSGKVVKHRHAHMKRLRAHPGNSSDAARRAYYRELEPYRSMDFKDEFPGNCAVQRAAGECMIDLGYGRCESCNTGGPP